MDLTTIVLAALGVFAMLAIFGIFVFAAIKGSNDDRKRVR